MADACLFCRIVEGSIPADVVAESTGSLAFRDINPQAPTHVLIIPRQHVASLSEVTDPQMVGDLLSLTQEVATLEGLENGWRWVANVGTDGGQSVYHLHFHLLGGRQLGWPPG